LKTQAYGTVQFFSDVITGIWLKSISIHFNEEMAIGAVDPAGNPIVDDRAIVMLHVGEEYMKKEIRKN
jgi:predicted phosphoribosyltransferase